jgi:TonB family protein
MKADNIFISYSRTDSAFVIKLEEDLAQAGIFIWLDQKKISAGKLWDRTIEEALEMSGILIVVVSPKSALSENVANEVQYAREEGKIIVPILIKQTKIPLTWRRYQRIDFIENYEAGLNNLAQTLKYEMSQMFNSETEKDELRLKEVADATKKEERKIKKPEKITARYISIIIGIIAVMVIVVWIVNSERNNYGEDSNSYQFENKNSETEAWNDAKSNNTIEGFKSFLLNYPDGVYFIEAQKKIDEIIDKDDWDSAILINTKVAYQEYLKKHPDGRWIADANQKITVLDKLILKKNEQQREVIQQKSNSDNEEVYSIVEDMPEFPGGELALRQYIANSVKYPVIAQKNGIQGKVYVTFVIGKDGSVYNVSIARSVDPSLDKEALRVVNAFPKWKPGKQRGKPVNVSYTVPINFVLE